MGTSLQIIDIDIDDDDDDDGFDWEAAVREIDVACQKLNTPSASSFSSHFTPPIPKKFGSSSCKQSTLDNFISKPQLQPYQNATTLVQPAPLDDDNHNMESSIQIDVDAAQTWIYPVNIPLRDYQFAITKTALFSNTLVALPTGLGKTLIAAVVMYNYFRWFPEGKIVFAAPSRPLVMQQIEACHNIVGIPQEWTIDMTGQISPMKRASFWQTKRVFFVTPQVLEKDIQAGTCLVRHLVCLVIDEAHRATGNYSYCVAVRELMSVPVQLRILALTATPGSKQPAIQHIIDNLHISTLEYRNESDPDVSPYVHNRKIELIEVALGKDATDINHRLIEVIRPYVARLSAVGLLQNRDYQTLSPPDLLNSRDKFRRAPPPELHQSRYGEIEAYFGGLITLYHIRKLLSSHGIRPAYEMLEEKLKQGPFARLMSKNEEIKKVKLLMQQSLSHGAPSPKLSKLLDVLADHFKRKDPQNSRVIIFSNFRGSVRDIMNALTTVGDLVKATEFIGQSSGKVLKGQSQKVQQAVLQKFRNGGYNVIVATSIGEEGLDIMEVDLVICFDANVSPLRMIQRMGRTGRKHDGRVVVLACEGSELKGYMRKQATSRAIGKHMHNGGINSFNFHSSPRMIPHILKPEVQLVELSIEKYVPHRRRVKADDDTPTPLFKEKLTISETALIAKYFQPENTWKPSLIAFPRFQALPSRVHKVMHSNKTNMLIDSMQLLQTVSIFRDRKASIVEDEVSSSKCLGVEPIAVKDDYKEDLVILYNPPSTVSPKEVTDSEPSPVKNLRTNEMQNLVNQRDQILTAHSFLFGSDYVSVDALGKVLILSVPLLPSIEVSHSKSIVASGSANLKTSGAIHKEITMQRKVAQHPAIFSEDVKKSNVALAKSRIFDSTSHLEKKISWSSAVEIPPLDRNESNEGGCVIEAIDIAGTKASSPQAGEHSNNPIDAELSPRLTNMIKTGFVPESPINYSGLLDVEIGNEFLQLISPIKFCSALDLKSPSPRKFETAVDTRACQRSMSGSVTFHDEVQFHTPLCKVNSILRTGGCASISSGDKVINSPLENVNKSSSSKDWFLSSREKSENEEPIRKFKRLRKIGDIREKRDDKCSKKSSLDPTTCLKSFNHIQGKTTRVDNVRTYIEEEAEVSSEAEVSDDEEDEPGNSSYEDSFIDDRINPIAASTQTETSRVNMMAVYRRSLLSQSPMERDSSSNSTFTPGCVASTGEINRSGSSSVKALCSIHTPQTNSGNQSDGRASDTFETNTERCAAIPSITTEFTKEQVTKLETRKRKLFCQSGSIPAINLEQEFSLQSEAEAPEKQSCQQDPAPADRCDGNGESMCYDDQFFAALDLNAVEAQATFLLKHKSEMMHLQKQDIVPESKPQKVDDIQGVPSFDLGIG